MHAFKRFNGPIAGTAASQTLYTSPSGTGYGDARGARLMQVIFANSAAVPAAYSLAIQSTSGADVIAAGNLLSPYETKIVNLSIPLEAADLVVVSCATTVKTTVSGEEYHVGGDRVPNFAFQAIGTGSAATVYTAPSGTAIGAKRGARLMQVVFCNNSGAPSAHELSIRGAATNTTRLIPAGTLLAAGETKIYNFSQVMASGETIQISCGTNVGTTATVEEYVIG